MEYSLQSSSWDNDPGQSYSLGSHESAGRGTFSFLEKVAIFLVILAGLVFAMCISVGVGKSTAGILAGVPTMWAIFLCPMLGVVLTLLASLMKSVTIGGWTLFSIMLLPTFLSSLFRVGRMQFRVFRSGMFLAWFAVILIGYLTSFLYPILETAILIQTVPSRVLLVWMLVDLPKSAEDFWKWMFALAVLGAFCCFVMLLVPGLEETAMEQSVRVGAEITVQRSHDLGFTSALAFLLLISFRWGQATVMKRVLIGLGMFASLVAVLFSQTRTVWMALLGVLGVSFASSLVRGRFRRSLKIMAASLCGVALIALVLYVFFPNAGGLVIGRIERTITARDLEAASAGRFGAWRYYSNMFLAKHFAFGGGLGYFHRSTYNVPHPHNDFLHVANMAGIGGLLLLVLFYMLFYKATRGLTDPKKKDLGRNMLVFMLVASLTAQIIFRPQIVTMVGIMIVMEYYAKHQAEELAYAPEIAGEGF